MKQYYKWAALLALALIVGYVSGRGHERVIADEGGDAPEARRGGMAGAGDGLRRSNRNRTRSGKGLLAASAANSRARQLALIEMDENAEWEGVDPFGGDEFRANWWPDYCAWALTTPLSDFPAVMEKVGKLNTDNVRNKSALLLSRWAALDPDSAYAWLSGQHLTDEKNYWENLGKECFLIEAAVRSHPEWAVGAVNRMHQKAKAMWQSHPPRHQMDDDDPFSGGGESPPELFDFLELEKFSYKVAAMPKSVREGVLAKLDFDLTELAPDAWSAGIYVSGVKDLDQLASLAGGKDDQGIPVQMFERLVADDWKKAKGWLDSQKGNEKLDSVVAHRWRALPEGGEESNTWYLSRAVSQDDLVERVRDIVRNTSNLDDRWALVERYQAQGLPTQQAWKHVYRGMKRSGRYEDALQAIEHMDPRQRQNFIDEVYQSASKKVQLWGLNGQNSVYLPNEKHEKFYANHPSYYEYIRENNARAIEALKKAGVDIGK